VIEKGIKVINCITNSPGEISGVKKGDSIISVDGKRVSDCLDFLYYSAEPEFELEILRREKKKCIFVSRDENEPHGIIVEDPPIRKCANNCFFCYVKQTPPKRKFRKGLSIRDDDYRHSFLYGHYVTLTNISKSDIERIKSLKLSPLYVSVHSAASAVRKKLFGRDVGAIMPLLKELTDAGIELHAQIVLIKGVNDGEELKNTLNELYSLYPKVKTVAVVPVGLTNWHHPEIAPWRNEDAEEALIEIIKFGSDYPKSFVQAADEWFCMTRINPPPANYYGRMEVEENGVGMIRRMLDEWKKIKLPKKIKPKSCLIVTGLSPKPFIDKIVAILSKIQGLDIELSAVENKTFGRITTVTGLLSWRDIRQTILETEKDIVFIPDVMLNSKKKFLDDISLERARKESGKNIQDVSSSAEGFREIIKSRDK